MDIKKVVQEIVTEAAGVQMDVKNMSEALADLTIERLNRTSERYPKIMNGKPWTVTDSYFTSDHEDQRTKIGSVALSIQFTNSLKKSFKGKFNPGKTKTIKEGLFSVELKIEIECEFDKLKDYASNIRSVVAHELNHAFVFIHDVNKRAAEMNAKRAGAKLSASYDPGVEMLNKALYLTNPMEVQARIQDIGGLVADLKSETASEAISELLLYQPFQELVDLNRMYFGDININDAVQEFVHKMGGSEAEVFMRALDKKRGETATKALRKVYRLISDRYKVEENFVVESDAFGFIYDEDCYSGPRGPW